MVASIFWDYLKPDGPYWGRFRHVLFSVFDKWSGNTYQAFAKQFAQAL